MPVHQVKIPIIALQNLRRIPGKLLAPGVDFCVRQQLNGEPSCAKPTAYPPRHHDPLGPRRPAVVHRIVNRVIRLLLINPLIPHIMLYLFLCGNQRCLRRNSSLNSQKSLHSLLMLSIISLYFSSIPAPHGCPGCHSPSCSMQRDASESAPCHSR